MKDDLTEKYIEHEIQLRKVYEKVIRFENKIETRVDKLHRKINIRTGIFVIIYVLQITLQKFGVL